MTYTMKDLILFFLLLILVVLTIWNLTSFIKYRSQPSTRKIDDARYWELKFRLDFIVAITVVIVGGLSFIGYDRIDNISDDVKSDIEHQVENAIQTELDPIRQRALEAQALMDSLLSKNIVQQELYVVRSQVLLNGRGKVYFKNLVSDKGKKLPLFTSIPLVIPTSLSAEALSVHSVTKESFELSWVYTLPATGVTADLATPDVPKKIEYHLVVIGK